MPTDFRDEPKITRLERDYLETSGFETTIVNDGQHVLAENPNIVFSKEQLLEKIWGYDHAASVATVSVHINRLREKIETDARNPLIIETIWGAGYRLNA